MEESYKLATSGYLTADVARQFAGDKIAEIEQYKVKCQHTGDAGNIKALEKWEKKFATSNIRARRKNSLSGVKSSEISIYRGIFEILAQASSSPQEAIKTIESILKHKSSNSLKRRKR